MKIKFRQRKFAVPAFFAPRAPVFVFIFAAVLLCTSAAAQKISSTVVNVAGETVLEKKIVYLGDIAGISGNDQAGIEKLEKISLGYAPNLGMTREIPVRKINLAIAAAGFSGAEVSVKTPRRVLVKRASRAIGKLRIEEAVRREILERFEGGEIEAKILRLSAPESIEIPVGEVEISIEFDHVRNPFQPFSLPVVIRINDDVFRRISVDAEIEAFAEVFVAARDLLKNSRIAGAADVRRERVRLEKPLIEYLYKTESLRGLKIIRDTPAGAVLTKNSFVPDIVVKPGDLVQIVGQSGRIQVVVTGEARASGRIGDRIAVKNMQSNKIIQAEIFDEGLVRVFF